MLDHSCGLLPRARTSRAPSANVLLTLCLLTACNDPISTVVPVAPAVNLSSQDIGVGVPTNVRPEEAAFADLSRQAPSAAGFYYNGTGITVRVRRADDGPLASEAIRTLAASGRIRRAGMRGAPAITVESADFTFKQLSTWRDLAFDNALVSIRGVNSLDLDEVRNRVALGIDPESYRTVRAAVVSALTKVGVDSTALVFDSVGRFAPNVAVVPAQDIRNTADTLAAGLEIAVEWTASDFHTCTLGFIATRNSQLGLVTNSHCTSEMYLPDFSPVHQRAGRVVGTESVDPYGYLCGFSTCRGSDAAFFASSGVVPMAVGLIHKTTFPNAGGLGGGFGSFEVDQSMPYFIVSSQGEVFANEEVHKVGRTTGWTRGEVKQTCADTYPRLGYLMRCGYEAWYVAGDGDSGSPVFAMDPDACLHCVKLVGIHSSRNTMGVNQAVFAKLSRIQSDMGGNWTVIRSPSLNPPVVSGNIVGGRPVVSWFAVPGAIAYHVSASYYEYICDGIIGCYWRLHTDKWVTNQLSITDYYGDPVSSTSPFSTGALGEREYQVWVEGTFALSPKVPRYFQP